LPSAPAPRCLPFNLHTKLETSNNFLVSVYLNTAKLECPDSQDRAGRLGAAFGAEQAFCWCLPGGTEAPGNVALIMRFHPGAR
jgi:hypothetical protein